MKQIALMIGIAAFIFGCYFPVTNGLPPNQNITYKVAYPWDSTTTYHVGDTATRPDYTQDGPIYQSLVDNNTGIEPPALFQPGDAWYGHEDQFGVTSGWQNYWIRIR
jgi:hypothetical protein